jgi:hypothetical protein
MSRALSEMIYNVMRRNFRDEPDWKVTDLTQRIQERGFSSSALMVRAACPERPPRIRRGRHSEESSGSKQGFRNSN